MKFFGILVLVSFLVGCASNSSEKKEIDKVEASQKITITGTRIKKSEIPSGPKLKVGRNKQNESSELMVALSNMQILPKPKDIGDCNGLIRALLKGGFEFTIQHTNSVILKDEDGIYEYIFDDSSCPKKET